MGMGLSHHLDYLMSLLCQRSCAYLSTLNIKREHLMQTAGVVASGAAKSLTSPVSRDSSSVPESKCEASCARP